MYIEAYELLREILSDEALNKYIFNETGKHLAVIDAGARITTPSANIVFLGGETSYANNTSHEVRYRVEFNLPYWGNDALRRFHEFLDVAIKAFFKYEQRINPVYPNLVKTANPSISEQDEESEEWTVAFDVTVLIFN